jgi:2-polyprenyl-3-methyl-5-hydroxy-6-metoxy-1,4-benzoquinol methylase
VIERWSEGAADENMAEEILVDLADLVHGHPWWRARAALTLDLLDQLGIHPPAQILDAGCGWGVTLQALERRGYDVLGMDISRRALERLDRPNRRLVEADLAQPLGQVRFVNDAVLALDVIEHLDDDRAAVARLGMLARPGGFVIVSVPALPALFTEFDAIQGHRRRYMPETLRAAFAESGLILDRIFWWGRWLVPALRRSRARSRLRPGQKPAQIYRQYLQLPPWPVPLIARLAFLAEHGMALRGRLRSGTSLLAVARRPETGDIPPTDFPRQSPPPSRPS